MKKILLSLIILWAFFMTPTLTFADYFTPAQPAGVLLINKLVKSPNGSFVENLGVTDPHFLPEQEVMFRIEVKNVGNKDLVNVEMKDKLPDWVDFVQGPGTFDKNSKTISFKVDKLTPNEIKTFDIKAKVKPGNQLPTAQITCVSNLAEGRIEGMVAQDTAVFCIETKILGAVSKLPVTGPNQFVINFAGALGALAVSILLLRKSQTR